MKMTGDLQNPQNPEFKAGDEVAVRVCEGPYVKWSRDRIRSISPKRGNIRLENLYYVVFNRRGVPKETRFVGRITMYPMTGIIPTLVEATQVLISIGLHLHQMRSVADQMRAGMREFSLEDLRVIEHTLNQANKLLKAVTDLGDTK